MNKSPKILYIFDANDWNSRLPVANEAKIRGYDITIGLIGENIKQHETFKTIHIPKPSVLKSIFPTILNLQKIISAEKPDILHAVTLKYAFLCALATLGQPALNKIYTLAGLGYLFHTHNPTSLIMRIILKPFIRFLFSRPNTTLIFQNPDDINLFITKKYAQSNQCYLIRGSGVDLFRFNISINPDIPPLILMPTRLVKEKGIHIFIDAARILKKKGIQAKFQIAGGETTHNPRAISAQQMLEMTRCGTVEWLGRINDIPSLLAKATLIVYPSYYGEGIPRVLLEACAAGKAIITTDHTGCREAVAHGINGLLVPIKDAIATAQAIEVLLNDNQRRLKMEQLSRKRAESEFDINLIAKKTTDLYDTINKKLFPLKA